MAITGHASYIRTTEDFLDHWVSVDGALGATPLVLKKEAAEAEGPVSQVTLDELFTDLQTQMEEVAGALNDIELAREELELKKTALLVRLNQFNARVRADLANTKWPKALSDVPSQGDAPEAWRNAIDDALSVWAKINTQNALGPATPLLLLGGQTLAQFTIQADDLREAFRAKRRAEKDAVIERGERDAFERKIYAILKAYRLAVPTKFAAGAPLVASLPRLTPESTGHTPDPVTASGAWDVPLQAAKVTHTLSSEPNVKRYDLRGCRGRITIRRMKSRWPRTGRRTRRSS